MSGEIDFERRGFERFAADVLESAVYAETSPLDVGILRCTGPTSWDAARGAEFEPVEPGIDWGPAWSTAWFRLRGAVPETMAGKSVSLRFSSGTEALLWREGVPHHGLDRNHDRVTLFDPAAGGEPIDLLIEASCAHAFGTTTFHWDPPEMHERWTGPKPGRLARCELAVYDALVWRLRRTWMFACQLLAELGDEEPRAQQLARALSGARAWLDDRDVPAGTPDALDTLEWGLAVGSSPSATTCHAVGHAHIDTAWLWPLAETKRKCLRTFSTVLRLMEEFNDFCFVCSQAQQYAWVRESTPALFEQIAERVREHRWEPIGSMWIEPDCNVPSGESLVRQILHGVRFWRDCFGDAAPQSILYLPDTFGFPAALPQIMKLAGLELFVTNKLSWNQTNEFPYVNFMWCGLDGTQVLAHCTPGHDYNALNTPRELRRGERNAARLDRTGIDLWLQPFGYGDGGGGPTDWNILNARLAAECEGLPRVEMSSASNFSENLRRAVVGRDLPVWDGELYLELHRGTLTTQAWLKRANRRAEFALRRVEWLDSARPPAADGDSRVAGDLDATWKLVLLNQFHDILPGSSITPVYEDARVQHEQVRETTDRLAEEGYRAWVEAADTREQSAPMAVFNPGSTARAGVVECDGALRYVGNVPALGFSVVDRASSATFEPVVADGPTLSNGLVAARVDTAGRVASLVHLPSGRDACGDSGPLNRLVLYEDRPRDWEAWDIDADYAAKGVGIQDAPGRRQLVAQSPYRAVIEVERTFGRDSRIVQRFVLDAGSPRLDIETLIDWREDRRLLRALFPVNVRAHHATYETQFGHVVRSSDTNTAWEKARFEVCAHTWMDLSEPGFGAALLNDCKYGHSCFGNVMGLSLVRSPRWPDPEADRGEHELTYSLMPHAGDWRWAGVDREAHALNDPLVARAIPSGQAGSVIGEWAPFTLESSGAVGVVVSALKRAEEGPGLVLRVVETHGGRGEVSIRWRVPADRVEPCDLLERPMALEGFRHEGDRTTFTVRPFQIVSLLATP